MESLYRACVLAVFTNSSGQVLVAQRRDDATVWQFPQGGIELGEKPQDALFREMNEELGVRDLVIDDRLATTVKYDFPENMTADIAKQFRGQEQTWFLVRMINDEGPNLAMASDPEFASCEWVAPLEALRRVAAAKKAAYRQGLIALGLLTWAQAEGV